MIYLDTSAAVKAMIDEPATEAVRAVFSGEAEFVSSRLLDVELHSVADRRGIGDPAELIDLVSFVALDDDTATAAIALHSGLRSLDALHLATAHGIRDSITGLLSFDRQLTAAARRLGIPIHPLSEG